MNKFIEKIMYSFGFNISAYDVEREFGVLEKHIPHTRKGKDVVDIGCGDGKMSMRLKKISESSSFQGVDLSPALIKSARKRGLDAQVLDIEKEEVFGDIAILRGVLHHLENPRETLSKLRKNFSHILIRESIDKHRFFELGNKWDKKDLFHILESANLQISNVVKIPENKSILIFF